MADDVKWIKIKVGMFDGTSFKRIKKAKIGGEKFRDKLTAVWFELLDLAGKCNNNGYLFSDEIPFGSEEDISIMLDRELDEIQLCLRWYKENKMIEIIDDMYCLSNWNKYQNVEGLERIREQNRIRKQNERERKKLCHNVSRDTSRDVTLENKNKDIDKDIYNIYNNILSVSEPEIVEKISEKEEIFNFWNEKNIIKHRNLTKEIENSLEKSLKKLNKDMIIECIDRYSKVLSDKNFYFDYKWSLTDFLNRKNGISSFTDEGSMWVSYITSKNKTNQITNENTDDIAKKLEERINARKGNYGI